jgi:hypothetical protein
MSVINNSKDKLASVPEKLCCTDAGAGIVSDTVRVQGYEKF